MFLDGKFVAFGSWRVTCFNVSLGIEQKTPTKPTSQQFETRLKPEINISKSSFDPSTQLWSSVEMFSSIYLLCFAQFFENRGFAEEYRDLWCKKIYLRFSEWLKEQIVSSILLSFCTFKQKLLLQTEKLSKMCTHPGTRENELWTSWMTPLPHKMMTSHLAKP